MTKRSAIVLSALTLFFILTACTLFNVTVPDSADEFYVGINSPMAGETLTQGPVEIVYFASSKVGISKVELNINGAVAQSSSIADGQNISVLQYDWTPAGPGSYLIRVRAQNTRGAWSSYEEASINVTAASTPTTGPTPTLTPAAAINPTATKEPAPSATPNPVKIYGVDKDVFTFFYGDNSCGQKDITITAQVNKPDEVKGMVLFTRFADQESFLITDWDSGASMSRKSDDTFKITLKANELKNYSKYEFATLFYQIVATDEGNHNISRTVVFKDAQMEICPQPSTPDTVRFKNYSHNVDTFYNGVSSCGPNEITITTDITRPEKVAYVILFTRFKDQTSDKITNWDVGGTMKKIDDNTHRITLQSQNLTNYNAFDYAAMSYQFVATDKDKKVVSRSLVFDDISLERCGSK